MFEMKSSWKILLKRTLKKILILSPVSLGLPFLLLKRGGWQIVSYLLIFSIFIQWYEFVTYLKQRVQISGKEIIVSFLFGSQKIDIMNVAKLNLARADSTERDYGYEDPFHYVFTFFYLEGKEYLTKWFEIGPKVCACAKFYMDFYSQDDLRQFVKQVRMINPNIVLGGDAEIWQRSVGFIPESMTN
jgi:hypothetical protein